MMQAEKGKAVLPLTNDAVLEALKGVLDPELGINVVDLGLIYEVQVDGGKVRVQMTLTTPGCPMHQVIGNMVGQAIDDLPGVEDVEVRIVWEPRWTPERLSPDARKFLGIA